MKPAFTAEFKTWHRQFWEMKRQQEKEANYGIEKRQHSAQEKPPAKER